MRDVRRGVMRHVATAVVVLMLQSMAMLMTIRRDPLTRFEGTVITAALWWTTRPRDLERDERTA